MDPKTACADSSQHAGAARGGQAGAPDPSENVDRIREILFGAQMREYAQRFAQLEERLLRETSELKGEVCRRLESAETYTKQEIESLADRQKSERTERTELVERISRNLSEETMALERRLVHSDEQLATDLREVRQSLLERHRNLLDELTQCVGRLETLQNRRMDEIHASSVDRLALANLLSEVSMRIRGEFQVPGMEEMIDAGVER